MNPTPVPNYEQPDWYNLPNKEVYFDEKLLKYCVVITTNYLNFSNQNVMNEELLDTGVKELISFYNKSNDDVTIQSIKSSNFTMVQEIHVPYRRMARIRGLVTVQKQFFDSIPSNASTTSIPLGLDISEANFILKIPLFEIKSLFKTVSNTLRIYNTDVYFSNSKIGLSFKENDILPYNAAKQIIEELSLAEKADNVDKFLDKLLSLFDKNNISYEEDNSTYLKTEVQFAINDKCNKIYDIAINKDNFCTKLRIGIEKFLKSNPIDDETTVALIKNIHRISRIERCKVPWPEFVETYIYPKVTVVGVSLNDVVQNFEKNKNQYAKDILQIFSSLEYDASLSPAKNYKETLAQEEQIFNLKLNLSKDQLFKKAILDRNVYVGDNFVDRQNLDKFFDSVIKSIDASSEVDTNDNSIIAEIKAPEAGILQPVFRKIKKVDVPEIGSYYAYNTKETTTYEKSLLKAIEPFELQSVIVFKDEPADEPYVETRTQSYLYRLKENRSEAVRTVQKQLDKLYDTLNVFGLCKMIDYSLGCALSFAKSFIDIGEIQASITIGTISSFNFDEMATEVIPYLPQDQQELVYKELLERTSCLNVNAILFILRKTLPTEVYESYGFDTDQFSEVPLNEKVEKINEALSKLMSTRVQ